MMPNSNPEESIPSFERIVMRGHGALGAKTGCARGVCLWAACGRSTQLLGGENAPGGTADVIARGYNPDLAEQFH